MNIKLILDYIAIEHIPHEKKTMQGVYVPTNISSSPVEKGVIVATGPGRINASGLLVAPSLKVGDNVLFRKQRCDVFEEDKKTYYFGLEEVVWGKINE